MFSNVSIENHRVAKALLFLLSDVTFPTGSIPRQIGKMAALQRLHLFGNKLTGEAYACCGIFLVIYRDVRRSIGCDR